MDIIYKVSGVVIHGDGRGEKLGYPTANIRLHKNIPEGIYAGTVTLNGRTYHAASFVGSAKTFLKTEVNVESFIFNFDSDIYGKWITVKIYQKIRDNEKFNSVDELVIQMNKDVEKIKDFFSKIS